MTDVYQKKILIEQLEQIYPYPRSWFLRQSVRALVGMLMKSKPISLTVEVDTNPGPKRKYEEGSWWVETESGWEIEIN